MKVIVDGEPEDVRAVELIFQERYILQLIDQRLLPHRLEFIRTSDMKEAISWITDMAVRGAPAIGATGAYALVLGLQANGLDLTELDRLKQEITAARPTAKDLDTFVSRAIDRIKRLDEPSLDLIADLAKTITEQSRTECELIGKVSKHLIEDGMGVLTHCNAGALATVDYGTALSPMRFAHQEGTRFTVYVDETRPRLQGMLTAWELEQEGIDHRIIVDNAAGFFMQQGKVDLVITGTDRVIADGTVTNKIGTLEKAVVAHSYGIPVYIAMPWTTYDPDTDSAEAIPIEYRSKSEVSRIRGMENSVVITPEEERTLNPAFDITPAQFITGFITMDGVLKAEQLPEYYQRYLERIEGQ